MEINVNDIAFAGRVATVRCGQSILAEMMRPIYREVREEKCAGEAIEQLAPWQQKCNYGVVANALDRLRS